MTDKDPSKYLPIGVQKSYFLLPKAERAILNIALEQCKPGESDPILVGGSSLLKTALGLMSARRLKIEGIDKAEAVYTRGIESVLVRGENQHSKAPWPRVGERRSGQYHSGSASANLGEPPPAGVRRRDRRDKQEDRLALRNRIVGEIGYKGKRVEFFYCSSGDCQSW